MLYCSNLLSGKDGFQNIRNVRMKYQLEHSGNTSEAKVSIILSTSSAYNQMRSSSRIWRRRWEKFRRKTSVLYCSNFNHPIYERAALTIECDPQARYGGEDVESFEERLAYEDTVFIVPTPPTIQLRKFQRDPGFIQFTIFL